MTFFDGQSLSSSNSTIINKLKTQIETLGEQLETLSTELSTLSNTVTTNKSSSDTSISDLWETVTDNISDINSVSDNLDDYKESQSELIETQVLRATDYIEAPLYRTVETESVTGGINLYGSPNTRLININTILDFPYVQFIIPSYVKEISLNYGKIKIKFNKTSLSSQGSTLYYSPTFIDCDLTNAYIYTTIQNSLYWKYIENSSIENCTMPLFYYKLYNTVFSEKLVIDYIITTSNTATKEGFLELVTTSDTDLYTDLSDFTQISNGVTCPYGYFYDKNGQIYTDILDTTDSGNITISSTTTSYYGAFSFSCYSKGDIHNIKGSISTYSYSVPSGTTFSGTLENLTNKSLQTELIKQLDLVIPLYTTNNTVDAYLHITTSSKTNATYTCTLLGDLSSYETYYLGQTLFIA